MSSVDDLHAELAVAKAQGRGTDEARIKKQLAALGDVPAAPVAEAEKAPAAEARAAAAETRSEAPKGRTSARARQQHS